MLRPTLRLLQARPAPHASLRLSQGVSSALKAHRPVVALESTIITHGLPYPYNLEVALELEQTVREHGAEPATIALLHGQPTVGLEQAHLETLARCAEDPAKNSAIKASRRDIAHVLAKGKDAIGGTTVSGTMLLAHMAGIEIFATGGIGGVHRGAESSMDVSADLTELGRTPVAVFCSGPKSILDIPRTLEVLETHGVGVQTFNPSGEFPAFYTSSSGLFVPYAGSLTQAATSILLTQRLGLGSGQVFGVPIPESFEAVGKQIQAQVEVAVRESVEQGIDKRGKEATPWLLKRLAQLIPASKESNRALVVNNAKVAAQTAAEMERVRKDWSDAANSHAPGFQAPHEQQEGDVVVFGAAAIDLTSQASVNVSSSAGATTFPGRVSVSLGGVGRNVAEAAHSVLSSTFPRAVKLVAARGADSFGDLLERGTAERGMRIDGLFIPPSGGRTAVCSLQLSADGDLVSGVADMKIASASPPVGAPRIAALDGNLGADTLRSILSALPSSTTTLFEPTSLAKSTSILDAAPSRPVTIATPNAIELKHMHAHAVQHGTLPPHTQESDDLVRSMRSYLALPPFITHDTLAQALAFIHAKTFQILLVKLGSKGVLSLASGEHGIVTVKHHPPPTLEKPVVNTTGAGDSFAGAILAGLFLLNRQGKTPADNTDILVQVGQLAAARSLVSPNAVGSGLDQLEKLIAQ